MEWIPAVLFILFMVVVCGFLLIALTFISWAMITTMRDDILERRREKKRELY